MLGNSLLIGALALAGAVRAHDLPRLKLPWGTWEAQKYEPDPKIYLFKNVRFGAEPRRFSAPSFPDWKDDKLQTDDRSITCNQIKIKKLEHPPGGRSPLGRPDNVTHVETEDCLLLDIYVPVDAFLPDAEPLPVIVWVYGGAFAFGSKEQGGVLYTGQSMLESSNYNAIFVVGNYRLGAYGWLAGHYMEEFGTPNAGLHDQALLFRWVQDHIEKVKGNKHQVSAWGLSAGGSSILHHLIREDGNYNPLFKSFAVLSPGFEWAWDNSRGGKLDNMFKTFSELAGCGFTCDMECLREVTPEKLVQANQELFDRVRQTGTFPVGPAIDGKWVTTLPAVSFARGNYWREIDSVIVSHAMNESGPFVPEEVVDQETFDKYLAVFLPGDALEDQRNAIRDEYNCGTRFGGDFRACIGAIIEHLVITCNTRYVADAYDGKTYAMQYAFPSNVTAYHGSDLIPLFTNNMEEAKALLIEMGLDPFNASMYAAWVTTTVAPAYRKFFASFGVSGDPNTLLVVPPLKWSHVNSRDDELTRVVRVQGALNGFGAYKHVSDDRNTRTICDFWKRMAFWIAEGSPDKEQEGEEL